MILQQKLFEQLFCQKYDRIETAVVVYGAAKQTRVVFIKTSVRNLPFSIMSDFMLCTAQIAVGVQPAEVDTYKVDIF